MTSLSGSYQVMDHRGHDGMVAGFKTTDAINAYHH